MQLYPAIDLRHGNVVRLYQGDFDQEQRYANDPVELARSYAEAGANWLHVVDLDGARSGEGQNLAQISAICAQTPMQVQAGGGVRNEAACERLFGAGVSRVVVGSTAISDPALVIGWIKRYGPERVVIALDALCDEIGIWHVQVSGWTAAATTTLHSALARYADAGAAHVLCTDISRDGTLRGPNVALYQDLGQRQPGIAVQASGGVSGLDDLAQLKGAGVAGVVIGKALLDGRFTMAQALAC